MKAKNLFLLLFLFSGLLLHSQEENENLESRRKHRIKLGLGLNIPMKPNNATHDLGMSVGEQYEFLLWDHFSLIQSLSYNFISGKSVEEFYQNRFVITQYESFSTIPFQLGLGWYFGEQQRNFYIYFKGGIAYYWGASPAYPEITVNGNLVKEAIAREEFNGTFAFFTPSIGWQFRKLSIGAVYQGSINKDTQLNVLSLRLSYNIY